MIMGSQPVFIAVFVGFESESMNFALDFRDSTELK